jgi:hypothetical protein
LKGLTQWNDSFHVVKAKHTDKRTSFPASTECRFVLAVDSHSGGPRWRKSYESHLISRYDPESALNDLVESKIVALEQVKLGAKSPRDTKGIKCLLKLERGQRRKLNVRTIVSLGKASPGDLKEVIQGSRKGPSEQIDSGFANVGICSTFLIRSGFLRVDEFSDCCGRVCSITERT